MRGFDAKDPITATQVGYEPAEPLAEIRAETTLAGKRLGIVREFMPNITVNDTDSIRVFNEEVIPTLLAAGAELVESVNARDIALGWAVDDPSIPNIDIQAIMADMIPAVEPSFANASTLAAPSITTGLLPSTLRQVLAPTTPLFPRGTDVIAQRGDGLRSSAVPGGDQHSHAQQQRRRDAQRGPLRAGEDAAARGDVRVTNVLDLSIDFEDLDGDGDTAEHISFVRINDDATGASCSAMRPGVTPGIGVPAAPDGLTLDTQGEAAHLSGGRQSARSSRGSGAVRPRRARLSVRDDSFEAPDRHERIDRLAQLRRPAQPWLERLHRLERSARHRRARRLHPASCTTAPRAGATRRNWR